MQILAWTLEPISTASTNSKNVSPNLLPKGQLTRKSAKLGKEISGYWRIGIAEKMEKSGGPALYPVSFFIAAIKRSLTCFDPKCMKVSDNLLGIGPYFVLSNTKSQKITMCMSQNVLSSMIDNVVCISPPTANLRRQIVANWCEHQPWWPEWFLGVFEKCATKFSSKDPNVQWVSVAYWQNGTQANSATRRWLLGNRWKNVFAIFFAKPVQSQKPQLYSLNGRCPVLI